MEINVRPASHRCRTLFAATIVTATLVAQATVVAQAPKLDPKPDPNAGLPTFLLPVPAGDVVVGLSAEQWLQVVRESVNPSRPEMADRDPKSTKSKLEQTSRALGQDVHHVHAFMLGQTPVTNRQYEVFVKAMAARGEKIAPPFHWWYRGCKDDYEKKIEEIKKLFPADGVMAPVLYWKRFGPDLPYALKDEFGKGIEDHPVVCVTKKDALRFAGWLGMRLPTEEERTRAVRGDSKNVWPWGGSEIGDHYVEKVLKLLELDRVSNRHTRPVGSIAFLSGPFGHKDMTAHVWEYTATVGLGPISGPKAFEAEWKRTQKDKFLSSLEIGSPKWNMEDGVVAKGASYLSWGNPVEFQIDSRVWMQTDEVLEGVGFRLAKDPRPGYDLLVSLCASGYNQVLFQSGKDDQKVDFETAAGCERYVLDESGFPKEYHAASIAPVNWVTAEKGVTLQKLEEKSQCTPLLLGTVVFTEPVLTPKLAPGIYSIAYRKAGVPKDLKEAWALGCKEIQKAIKEGKHKSNGSADKDKSDKPEDASTDGKPEDGKGKDGKGKDGKGKAEDGKDGKKDDGKGKPEEGKEGKEGKKDEGGKKDGGKKEEGKSEAKQDEGKRDWRSVLGRYGLTEKDVEDAEAKGDVTFVRINDYQVPVDEDYFLFHDNAGKFVAHIKASALTAGNVGPSEITLGQVNVDKADRLKVAFKVRAPLLKDQKKAVEYSIDLILEQGPPAAGVTWRTPAVK